MRLGAILAAVLLLPLLRTTTIECADGRRIALLIAAPFEGEQAMHNDLIAMQGALRLRGFAASEILSIEGPLTRDRLMHFLAESRGRIAGWQSGEIFLYYTGHGAFSGDDPKNARPGLQLSRPTPDSEGERVYWDEVFGTLKVNRDVKICLLPDS
jgi:hypothetical protein